MRGAAEGSGGAGRGGVLPLRTVLSWLLALTAAEIVVAYLPLPGAVVAALLVLGALWKAALVALHFMHLRVERRPLLLALAVTVALALVFVLGLVPDLVFGPGAGRTGVR